jgi:glucokinase
MGANTQEPKRMSSAILVGDVGGTNCRFAFAELSAQGTIDLHHSERFSVKDFPDFKTAVRHYLDSQTVKPAQAAFAFAGPKFGDEIKMTNIDWVVSESDLCNTFGFENVVIQNDFVAMANGATVVPDDGFEILMPGKVNYNKPVAVLGPGTGLGISLIVPGNPLRILPTEGGHVSFSPQDELEREILLHQLKDMSYLSVENLISGPGLLRLYKAICDIRGADCLCRKPDEIVASAEANPKSIARLAVITFCNILGGFAGNAALTMGASGGVVIGGGVSRHVSPFLNESEFKTRFRNRGDGSWFVKEIPVRLIKAHFVALYGAAAMVLKK